MIESALIRSPFFSNLIRSTCSRVRSQVNLPSSVGDDVVGVTVGGGHAGAVGRRGRGEDDARRRGELGRRGGRAPPGQPGLQVGGEGGEKEQVEQEDLHEGE